MGAYETQITALQAAIGRAELRVEWDGRVVTYRNINEMIQAVEYFKSLEQAAAGTQRPRQIRVNGYSGWQNRNQRY